MDVSFLLFCITALAQVHSLGAVVTGGFVANDPFVERRGLALGVEYRARPWVSLTADVGGYPNLGAGDHTALTRSLIDEVDSGPLVSRTTVRAELGARWLPLRTQGRRYQTALGLITGAGLSRTADEAIGNDAELDAPVQVVPTVKVGVDAEARAEVWGVRASLATVIRSERIVGPPQTLTELWVSASLTWHPRRRQRDLDEAIERLEPSPE